MSTLAKRFERYATALAMISEGVAELEPAEAASLLRSALALVEKIGPPRKADHHRVRDAVYALATELRRLGAEPKAELLEGLACVMCRAELAAPALIVASVLERQSTGDVRAELAAGRASIEHAAGTRRREVRVDGEHLGTAEQDSAGDWHGHLSDANGGSTVLASGTEAVLVRTMLECADRHWAWVQRKATP